MPALDGEDPAISTPRLSLTPLSVEDAEEMAGVLDDPRLHEFIGGEPTTVDELRVRYRELVAGSGDPDEVWLNWIARTRSDGSAVGTLQATVSVAADGLRDADVAWVIGTAAQGHGYAAEAAVALVHWLAAHGIVRISAHIHPDHRASEAVARRGGLRPTGETHDGENAWRRP